MNGQNSPIPSGLTEVCPGTFTTYTVDPDVCHDNYNWSISPAIGSIVGNSNSTLVSVQFNAPGVTQLCLEAEDICNSMMLNPSCITINVSSIPPSSETHEICLGQSVICADQVFSNPGSYNVTLQSWLGCDSMVNCIITPIIVPPTFINPTSLCAPNSFEICGNTIDTSGITTITCSSFQGCDSLVVIDLVFLDPIVSIAPVLPINFTNTPTYFLDGSNSNINTATNGTTLYEWTGPGIVGLNTDDSLEINLPGQYCLELTHERDGVECIDITCVDVEEDGCLQPIINFITPDTILCSPNPLQLEVIAPTAVSYEWSPTGNLSCWDCPAPEAFPVHTEEYYVIVTDGDGCTEEAAVFVDVRFGLDWGLQPWSNSPVCEGDSLEMFTIFPTNIVEYNWTGPGNFNSSAPNPVIQNADILDAGTYNVTLIDDAGCEAITDFPVDVLENLGLGITITPEIPIQTCDGIFLSASSFPSNVTYLWEGPCILSSDTDSLIEINCLGTFYLTVTSSSGCSITDSLVVTEIGLDVDVPIADAGPDAVLDCASIEVELDGTASSQGPDFAYEWTTTNGVILSGANTLTPVINFPGTYTLTVTDIINDCSASSSVDVTLDIDAPVVSVSPNTQICEGADFEFCHPLLSGDLEYVWSNPDGFTIIDPCLNLEDISVDDSGIYCLAITNLTNSCTAQACFELEVFPVPEIISISNDTSVCKEEIVLLEVVTASPNTVFQWIPAVNLDNPNIQNPIAQVLTTITYVVQVIDANTGCANQDSVTITLDEDCVWPGDTDTNGVVNNFDLLNIGLAFDSIGPIRPNASLNWEAQQAPNWTQNINPPGINYKHIDTNGEGIISADDTLAITLNWGETHNFTGSIPEEEKNMGAPFYIEPDTLQADTSYALSIILGEAAEPANEIYGLAFSITYDPAMIIASDASAAFGNSWIGNLNIDMLAIHKWFPAEGRIDIGITRTDGLNMNGLGEIGTFYISIEDIIFFNDPDEEDKSLEDLFFNIENVIVINSKNEEISVDTDPEPFIVNGNNNLDLSKHINVFPNPADDILQVVSKDILIEKVELFNLTGQLQIEQNLASKSVLLNTGILETGTYILRIWTKEGVLVEKVIII